MSSYCAEIDRDAPFGPFRWHIVIIHKAVSGWIDHEIGRSSAWTRRGAEARARRMARRAQKRDTQRQVIDL